MCLDSTTATSSRDGNFVGYKMMKKSCGGGIRFPYYQPSRKDVQKNQWLKATNKKIGNDENEYRSGFHIFTTEADAVRFKNNAYYNTNKVIVKVLYKDIVAIGHQCGKVVIVAKMMKIVSEVK